MRRLLLSLRLELEFGSLELKLWLLDTDGCGEEDEVRGPNVALGEESNLGRTIVDLSQIANAAAIAVEEADEGVDGVAKAREYLGPR